MNRILNYFKAVMALACAGLCLAFGAAPAAAQYYPYYACPPGSYYSPGYGCVIAQPPAYYYAPPPPPVVYPAPPLYNFGLVFGFGGHDNDFHGGGHGFYHH